MDRITELFQQVMGKGYSDQLFPDGSTPYLHLELQMKMFQDTLIYGLDYISYQAIPSLARFCGYMEGIMACEPPKEDTEAIIYTVKKYAQVYLQPNELATFQKYQTEIALWCSTEPPPVPATINTDSELVPWLNWFCSHITTMYEDALKRTGYPPATVELVILRDFVNALVFGLTSNTLCWLEATPSLDPAELQELSNSLQTPKETNVSIVN